MQGSPEGGVCQGDGSPAEAAGGARAEAEGPLPVSILSPGRTPTSRERGRFSRDSSKPNAEGRRSSAAYLCAPRRRVTQMC
jgi:hypothetical protein